MLIHSSLRFHVLERRLSRHVLKEFGLETLAQAVLKWIATIRGSVAS